jgi:hypothetical protein
VIKAAESSSRAPSAAAPCHRGRITGAQLPLPPSAAAAAFQPSLCKLPHPENKVVVFSKSYCPYCTKGGQSRRMVLAPLLPLQPTAADATTLPTSPCPAPPLPAAVQPSAPCRRSSPSSM